MTTSGRARPLLTVGAGAVVLVALVVAGSGMLSYATDTDPFAVSGLGPWPGVLAMVAALVVWSAILLAAAQRRPGLAVALLAGFAAAVAYVLVASLAVLGLGIGAALAVASHLVLAGFAIVVLVAGVLAGVGVAVALRSDGTAQWPWEKGDEDE